MKNKKVEWKPTTDEAPSAEFSKLTGKPLEEPYLVPGEPQKLVLISYKDVDTPHTKGGEDVTIAFAGQDNNEVPVGTVKDNNNGTYDITFEPTPGTFALSVLLNGEPVEGSPVILNTLPLTKNPIIKLGGAGLKGGKIKKSRQLRPIFIKAEYLDKTPASLTPEDVKLELDPPVSKSPVVEVSPGVVAALYKPKPGRVLVSLTV